MVYKSIRSNKFPEPIQSFFIQLDMKNQKEAISSAFQAAIVIVSLSIGLLPAVMKSLPFRQHLSLVYWNSLSLSANR